LFLQTAATTEKVALRIDGDVAVITLQNPPVNSWHPSVGEGLKKAYQQAFADSRVKVRREFFFEVLSSPNP
jgi:enoyl-CoA hydratase/carnithine racemase